jgi:hypothetical membrane protein
VGDATPLVHRAVRSGGIVLAVGSAQFAIAMGVVQSRYAGYSLSANYISDLGGASSPWALVFDGSVILLGVSAILGFLLVWSAFDRGGARGLGLGFLLLAGAGAIGVGVFPETTHVLGGQAHALTSGVAFVAAGAGFTAVSFAMGSPGRWRFSRPYTLATGLVVLAACGLFEASVDLGIAPGGMERVIVYPVILWGVVEGIHLSRLHRFAPGLRAVASAAG